MGIDIFTLIAQLINLFVLVWLLKHFLYQPVLQIIEKRTKEIEAENQSSALLTKEINEAHQKLEKEKKTFEKSMQEQTEELTKELTNKKKKELKIIKEEVALTKQKLLDELKVEQEQAKQETIQFITKDFTESIEKVLVDFTKITPMDHIIKLFIEKFTTLQKSDTQKLNNIIKKQNVIYINSSETLNKKQQEKISSFIQKELILPKKCKILFKNTPSLIMGIELLVGTFSVQWTIKSYLDDFQENLDKHLNQAF